MSIARLTTRGRVTIPAEVRLAMQAKPGDRIEFVEVEPNRFVLFKARTGKLPVNPSSSGTASVQKI